MLGKSRATVGVRNQCRVVRAGRSRGRRSDSKSSRSSSVVSDFPTIIQVRLHSQNVRYGVKIKQKETNHMFDLDWAVRHMGSGPQDHYPQRPS